jgi:CRISPR-associated protein Csx3
MQQLKLTVDLRQTEGGLVYQHLNVTMLVDPITIDCLKGLQLPEPVSKTDGIVIEGRMPLWLYGYLANQLTDLPWIACYAFNLGQAVVFATRTENMVLGQLLPMTLPKAVAIAM